MRTPPSHAATEYAYFLRLDALNFQGAIGGVGRLLAGEVPCICRLERIAASGKSNRLLCPVKPILGTASTSVRRARYIIRSFQRLRGIHWEELSILTRPSPTEGSQVGEGAANQSPGTRWLWTAVDRSGRQLSDSEYYTIFWKWTPKVDLSSELCAATQMRI